MRPYPTVDLTDEGGSAAANVGGPVSAPGAFDLLVYANKNIPTPSEWEESDPQYVNGSEEVQLRSFSTSIHRVATSVTYKSTRDV